MKLVRRYPELLGKRVVVTGGSSGIGEATVNRFTLEGAQVAVLDRLPASQLPQTGLNLLVDVTSREGVEEAFLELDRIWGGVDILVANAGVSLRHRFADITSEEWQRVLATNLTGVFYCAQSAVRRMARAQSGTVLMTASTAATASEH